MTRTTLRRTLPALAALALVGCQDAPPVAPVAPAPDDVLFAKRLTTPTGKGIGVIGTKGDRTRHPVLYHGGAMLTGTARVYFIWYGNWAGSPKAIVQGFAASLGGTGYYNIVARYADPDGNAPSNSIVYAGSIDDPYSMGRALTESNIDAIVGTAVATGQLPADPAGVYVMLTSADVSVSPGFGTTSGTSYCAFRAFTQVNGVFIHYAFIGDPDRAPAECEPQLVSPNGSASADAIVSILANVIVNTVTDPRFSGWYDRNGLEPADKCAWSYGTTYTTANGARANVNLGGRDYLLQQLWVPDDRGYCALAWPPL